MPYTITLASVASDAGVKEFEEYISKRSYVDGPQASAADSLVFKAFKSAPNADKYPNAARWYSHIASFKNKDSLPGDASHVVLSAASAAAPAADDDDVDLFGDDEDPEAEKKWEEEMERRAKEGQAKIDARNAAAGKKVVGKSSVLMDVKPWDDETDLKAMEESVRSIEMDGLTWGASKLIEVAFGLKKLQIMATVVDDLVSVEELEEKIREFEDYVQSTDIVAFNKL